MPPKNPTRNTKCGTCKKKLGDNKAINCQLCLEWVCLTCTGVSTALHDFCQDNDETMAFLCKDCKLEIPSLREMKSIKLKQVEIEDSLASIQTDITATNQTIVDTNNAVTGISETQAVQGTEITKHEDVITDILNRLKAVEITVSNTEPTEETESAGPTWATVVTRRNTTNAQIKTLVRSEVNEQAEIEKIKNNLVISGMAETQSNEADKTAVLALIDHELNIIADINKTERIGKPRVQKDGEDPPAPRLMKLYFVTQRSRKEVLAKVTTLRKSTDDHVKKLVYIRPDLTHAQLEQSKNLRALLKTTRDNNPTKLYKIQRNQIIDVTLAPPTPQQTVEVTEMPPAPANNTDT